MADWHPIWRPRASMAEKRALMEQRQTNPDWIDRVNAPSDTRVGLGWYVLALLLPIAGGIAGIYWLAKGEVGPGLALWGTSFLGFLLAVMFLL